jgi:hypothetical protein
VWGHETKIERDLPCAATRGTAVDLESLSATRDRNGVSTTESDPLDSQVKKKNQHLYHHIMESTNVDNNPRARCTQRRRVTLIDQHTKFVDTRSLVVTIYNLADSRTSSGGVRLNSECLVRVRDSVAGDGDA